MIKLIIIMTLICIIELLIIIFLVFLLINKRKKQIDDYNNKIIQREEIEKQIINKWEGKEKELDAKIQKAKTARDFLDIISN